jgi:hypothetical protein
MWEVYRIRKNKEEAERQNAKHRSEEITRALAEVSYRAHAKVKLAVVEPAVHAKKVATKRLLQEVHY